MSDATAALGLVPTDLAAVESVVRAAGTSFYRGMRILPPDRRAAMYAVYAFCRLVDDVADEPAPIEEKRRGLDAWRERIAQIYEGVASGPVERALLAAVQRFGLRRADFLAVVDGMQMDAEAAIVAPDRATLDLYCDRVASAVGRLSVRAFGDSSESADEVAWHLGRALQLSNILRDLGEDAERGRLYLAREWLEAAGVLPDPASALTAPGLPRACAMAAAEAHAHFAGARAAMRRCDPRAMRPARVMGATYAAILRRLERRGWNQPGERVSLPKWEKIWIAARYLR